jgi:hypothetical protein
MTIDTWVSNLGASNTIDSDGTKTLLVGATLHVGIAQAPGLYTSASFDVTVGYN